MTSQILICSARRDKSRHICLKQPQYMKRLLLLTALLFSLTIASQSPINQIDSIVNSKIGADDPALFVGVIKDGAIIYKHIKGLANLQHQVPANEDTRSNIASTAKQFTALMILDLAQKGKLNLEDDIRKYIPGLYPKVEEAIKLRHLLNHTSGINDYCDLMGMQQDPWWRRVGLDNEDVIKFTMQQEALAFAPGSTYEYSNTGYNLLAKVVEVTVEKDFHSYSEQFFQALGMLQTTFLKSYMQVIPNLALPYSDWGDGVYQQFPMLTSTFGEGFLYTTLDDQLRFEQLLQNAEEDGNKLLLASQRPIPNSKRQTYGFGLELTDWNNHPAVHHAGGTGSYGSQVIRFPEERLTIFVMSSNSRVWTSGLADEIALTLLPAKEQVLAYDAKLEAVPQEQLEKQFVGQYYDVSDQLVRIVEEDGQLYWKRGTQNGISISQEGENLYHTNYDEQLKIAFFGNEITLFYPSGKTVSYTRMEIPQPSQADYEGYAGAYYSEALDVRFDITWEKDELMITIDGRRKRGPWSMKTINRDEFHLNGYIFRVERDPFDRVVGMSVSLNRARNVKFVKKSNLKFQPQIATTDGSIQVTTINSKKGNSSDILLTKNYPNGNEMWYRIFGGSSWDKASSIVATEDGYLIVGSTSSYGEGNYDMYVIKTDKAGKKLWQNTFGEKMNEYGYTAEVTEKGYLIKGTIQHCENDVFDCTTNVWMVYIDKEGNELSREEGEVIHSK